MECYGHLQAMPNSPLTPVTPLNENTKFEFTFGGDGSLDVYIHSVRQEHRVQQQQKKLLQHANKIFHKKSWSLQPRRYSEEFLKIREVFEVHEQVQDMAQHQKETKCARNFCCQYNQQYNDVTPKAPVEKITYTEAMPTPAGSNKVLKTNYTATPTNVRTPLIPKNHNLPQTLNSKAQKQIMQHLQTNQKRIFRQASPVAAKPLCPQVTNILQQRGLSMYSGLFQKEEIDLFTFHMLNLQDLHQLGITNQKHCAILMQDIFTMQDSYFKNDFKEIFPSQF